MFTIIQNMFQTGRRSPSTTIADTALCNAMNRNVENPLLNNQNTTIHEAARNNDKSIHTLIKLGANLNIKDHEGETPLMIAAEKGHIDLVQTLKCHGADINLENKHHETALYIAAKNGHKEIVELLINFGANAGHKDRYGNTPLAAAKIENHIEVVKFLFDLSGKPNQKWKIDSDKNQLMTAIHFGLENIVCELLNKEVRLTDEFLSEGRFPSTIAAAQGHVNISNMLFDKEIKELINIEKTYSRSFAIEVIFMIAKQNDKKRCKALIDNDMLSIMNRLFKSTLILDEQWQLQIAYKIMKLHERPL